MREAVRLVRSRVPGRIANAALRGRFAWFRVISNGRVLTVVVNRVTRRLRVRAVVLTHEACGLTRLLKRIRISCEF